jgi:hypothetical protein
MCMYANCMAPVHGCSNFCYGLLLRLQVCLELNQTWMESGVSEDAVSGHIQVGATQCLNILDKDSFQSLLHAHQGFSLKGVRHVQGHRGQFTQHAVRARPSFGHVLCGQCHVLMNCVRACCPADHHPW